MPPPPPDQDGYPRKWWILVAIGLTLFMGTIDGTIVNVALPTLTRELRTDFPTVQWVVLSFLLGITIFMLSMGRLGDLIGKKRVFSAGLILFVIGSILCGLAASIYWLIAFRFVQAIGAAMTLALGVAIVVETWPARERGKAIGLSGGIISLGIVAGPALGGLILQSLSWRWIFFVNLPIGLVAWLLVLLFVPPLEPEGKRGRFDFPGALLIGLSLLAFSLALTAGQRIGFTAGPILALFALFALGLAGFVWVERRSDHPMIDLRLLQNPGFSLNLFTGFLSFVAIAGITLLLPFYLELVLKLAQRDVGLLMAVAPLVLGVLGPLSGSLSDRVGSRPVSVTGLLLLLAGYLALTRLSVQSRPLDFVLLLLPVAMGMGTFQSPNNTAIMNAAPRQRLGVASGMLSMTRTLGQISGVAVLGAFFAARLHVHSGAAVDVTAAAPAHLVAAMTDQFLLAAALIGVALAIALWRWRSERRPLPPTASSSSAPTA